MRNSHIYVMATPPCGYQYELGQIQFERVGSLRPQLCPPYLPEQFVYVEHPLDFDQDSRNYYHTLGWIRMS